MKPGYKQTEIGVIPEDWEVKPLTAIADKVIVGIASAATHAYREKGIPMFRNQNIKSGYLDDSELLFIAPEYEAAFRNKRLREGDLLTMRTGYPGVTAIVPSRYNSAQSFTTLITRPKQQEAESAYLCHFINSEIGQRFFTQSQIGGAQKNVNAGTLRGMPVPLPKIPEQRAIAWALSDVDGLLGALDRLIAKKRDLKQAAMQQLLTGQTRLPGFHGEWVTKKLGEVLIRLANGAQYQPSDSAGLPVTRIETIADGSIDMTRVGYGARTAELEEYRLLSGDILFSHINSVDHIGKVAIYRGGFPLYHGMNLLLLRVGSSLDSQFLFYWLGSHTGRNKSVSLARQAVSQASINTSDLKRVEISLPPLTEQTAIAGVLSDMDAELAALEERREKTRALKQGMMQELLTGRIRLG